MDATTNEAAIRKLNKANIPFGYRFLAYYPTQYLLVARGTTYEPFWFTINRQTLVRFFKSDAALNTWLAEHNYEPIEAEVLHGA
jgi:hypothetical protein